MKNTKYSKENSKPLHLHKPKEIMSTVLCATTYSTLFFTFSLLFTLLQSFPEPGIVLIQLLIYLLFLQLGVYTQRQSDNLLSHFLFTRKSSLFIYYCLSNQIRSLLTTKIFVFWFCSDPITGLCKYQVLKIQTKGND